MKNNKIKSSNLGTLITIFTTVALTVVVIVFFGLSTIKENKEIKQADSLVEMKKYEEGISIYDNILDKYFFENDYLISKRDLAIELMKSDENQKIEVLEEAQVASEEAVEESGDNEEDILAEVEDLIENGNLLEAENIVDTYLVEWPNSIEMKNMKDTIVAKNEEIEKQAEEDKIIAARAEEERMIEQAKAEEEDRRNEEAKAEQAKAEQDKKNKEDKKNEEDKKKDESIPKDIVGSNRLITSHKANLREEPSLEGTIFRVLRKGAKVQVLDTKVENSDRTWCLVKLEGSSEQGWISYNTMNDTIQ